jgi:hypothetical protein
MSSLKVFNTGTYAGGMTAVVAVIMLLLLGISVLDMYCAWKHWPSIGYRVRRWSRRNPLFALGFLFVLALLMVHFVGNPIHYD